MSVLMMLPQTNAAASLAGEKALFLSNFQLMAIACAGVNVYCLFVYNSPFVTCPLQQPFASQTFIEPAEAVGEQKEISGSQCSPRAV